MAAAKKAKSASTRRKKKAVAPAIAPTPITPGANATADEDKIITLQHLIFALEADSQAFALIANEALSIALSHEADPDIAIVNARTAITKILDGVDAKVATMPEGRNKAFRQWICKRTRRTASGALDAVEKRVSMLKQHRIKH